MERQTDRQRQQTDTAREKTRSERESFWLVGFCFTSHQQRGHLEMALPFTVPCEGLEAR